MNSDFYYRNDKNNLDGFFPYCKLCGIEKSKARQKSLGQEIINYVKDQHKLKGKEYWEYQHEYNQDHKELNSENGKRWRESNPDKLKQYNIKRAAKNHKISKLEWIRCKEYFNNSCAYCGLPIEEHFIKYKGKIILGDFHKEHMDHDGRNDVSNCIPSCKICNSEKRAKSFDEWYDENNSKYSKERYDKIFKWINEDYVLTIK